MSTRDLLRQAGFLKVFDFARLEESVERITVPSGTVVIQEGDVGDAAYIIESGSAQVYITTADGAEIVTARLGPGTHFGEQALLRAHHRRNASVRAAEDSVLLRLPADTMNTLLTGDATLRQRLDEIGRRQDQQRFARQASLFKTMRLEDFEKLTLHESVFEAGSTVFHEGDVGDKVYLITGGRAAAYKDKDGTPTLAAVIEAGQCFGEMAIVSHTRRAATIKAEGELRTLWIDAASFAALLERTPPLQRYMTTLNRMYHLPRRGFVTQGTGQLMGEDAATCIYNLIDGTRLVALRTIDGRMFSMKRSGQGDKDGEAFKYEDAARGLLVEIVIDDGKMGSVTTVGEWDDLGTACDIILRGEPFDRWRASIFALTGRLQLEAAPSFGGDEDIFCPCMQVKMGDVRAAIAGGAPNVEAVMQKTGCSTVCGSCRPKLGELMGQTSWSPVRIGEVIEHTADIRSFRLVPWSGTFDKPALPGQHVVVQGLIDGKWVTRSYTLTSHPDERAYREITVKREQHGTFSSWLFQADAKQLLRISDPQGDVVAGEDGSSIVCVVGGIGVTPGLVMCRTFGKDAKGRRIYVDYSVSDVRDAVCLDEFRAYGANGASIGFNMRVTSQDGRLSRADVDRLVADLPEAMFIVCGPTAFERAVSDLLAAAGVPPERLKVERFTPAGGPVAPSAMTIEAKQRPKMPPLQPVEFPYAPVKVDSGASAFEEARAFLTQVFYENNVLGALPARLREVEAEIGRTGTYTQTYDELSYGCKIAWRNSVRCVGRVFWPAMKTIDVRHLRDETEIFNALVEHLRYCTNGGRIRCLTSFFAPKGLRVWNLRLVRYAGYRQSDGSILGDPSQVELTEQALALGWAGGGRDGKRSAFDLLPIIIQVEDRPPQLFELPEDAVLEVPIRHPKFRWFEELGLKWHAVSPFTGMGFDMGGVTYDLAPFNGWFMSAEIGARNFGDSFAYDMVPAIAEKMGLDMSSEATLWRDRALVELNYAVLHSYGRMGITLVDHHTIARKFMEHMATERAQGREVHADWAWVVPPLSGSQTPLFHLGFANTQYKPLIGALTPPWETDKP